MIKTEKLWKRIGLKHHHGIDIPLFALHTKESCGIGEFFDLIPLIDWCKEQGFDIIQLLPLNDSGHDPSPYNALSSCALNPIFLSLHQLPYAENYESLKTLSEEHVDYPEVRKRKREWLSDYLQKHHTFFTKQREYQEFLQTHRWLPAYALFKVFKQHHQHKHWKQWPEEHHYFSYDLYERYRSEAENYILLQYLCFQQLKSVKDYAHSQDIFIKGDIPILISSDSADVWSRPQLFNTHLWAGAPPDSYNLSGQCWGFPLYNWDIMEREDFSWWKQRLSYANHFYDLYRIDHVVGFFRIWAIPYGKTAKQGKFIPEDRSLWIPQGKKLLEMMIDASSMLPIAEDLGTVPPEVCHCLTELGICGTKVIRWERDWEGDKHFIPFDEYPILSLTCVSTHDSEPLALWWQHDSEEVKAFISFKHWHYTPQLGFAHRKELLRDSHHTPSLFHINLLQEYLALFPELVWPTPSQERINIPGTILPTNWTYRFRPSLETIAHHHGLKNAVKEILA